MEEKKLTLVNECSFRDVSPIMMSLPYPPVRVKEKNPVYAGLLSIDYCGAVSELSAITQYINHHARLSMDSCTYANILLGIAMAEMIHLQKLGQLVCLLGGTLNYSANFPDGRKNLWTPQYLTLPCNMREILSVSIKGEKDAIEQYVKHMRNIRDEHINAVLERIVWDEKYHLMILQSIS